ncbi:MAG: hypothetical protein K2L50_00635 [Bacteroidales bacterium]|nr:hypothetical protein [Bacteroidales bacterium]
METRTLEVVSLSKKEFDNLRAKPDNCLFFVYDEYVSEDKKAKVRIRLYKGQHLILGDLYETVSNLKGCDCSFKVGEVGFLPAGSVPEVTNSGDEKNVVLNVKIPESILLEAGTASLLTADEPPTINVSGNKINIGVPSSPYLETVDVELSISDYPTSALNDNEVTYVNHLGYAEHTESLEGDWLKDNRIFGKRERFKNDKDFPCFVFVKTFPANGDTENYSSTDNLLLIPPRGKGMVTHNKTYPVNGVGTSEVYPRMETKPEIVFDIEFKGTDRTLYDSVNNIQVAVDGTNITYDENGLRGTGLTITVIPKEGNNTIDRLGGTLPPDFPRSGPASHLPLSIKRYVNELDSILYKNAFHYIVHFRGASAKNVTTRMCCAWSGDAIYTGSKKILVASPIASYTTDNLDLLPWNELHKMDTVNGVNWLTHYYSDAISVFQFIVENNVPIKGIRIISGTPADFLRDPNFLLYKFD